MHQQCPPAVARRDAARRPDRAARQTAALPSISDIMHSRAPIEERIARAMKAVARALGARAGQVLQRADDGRWHAVGAAFDVRPPDGAGPARAPRGRGTLGARLGRRALLIEDAVGLDAADLPAALRAQRSVVAVPVRMAFGAPVALVLAAPRPRAFQRADLRFLNRVARVMAMALEHHALGQRAEVLSSILGQSPIARDGTLRLGDPSVTALSRALSHTATWQGRIVEITNELLSACTSRTDAAINAVLAATGQLSGADRTYVFRLRAPDRLDNTHEWVADGIEPMIDQLQDMPASLMEEWRATLESGTAVCIPDIAGLPDTSALKPVLEGQNIRSLLAVPMLRDGTLTGFIGYDAVRAHRHFLMMEIQLLQAVANAIKVVIDHAETENEVRRGVIALETERDRLESTLTALPDLVMELDADARFIACNAAARVMTPLRPEAAIGQLPEAVLPPALAARLRAVVGSVARHRQLEEHEFDLEVRGETRHFIARAAPLPRNRAPDGFILVIRDITGRKRQSLQLQRLAKVAELTSNAVIVTDAHAHIDWVNPAFENQSGWRLDEVRGRSTPELLLAPATHPATRARVAQAYRLGEALQIEMPIHTRWNEEHWVSNDIQPLRDAQGGLLGMVSVVTDITSLKRSQLRALRDRAQAMDVSTDAISICEIDGPISYMNRAHRQMLGIGEHESLQGLTWTDFVSPDTVRRFRQNEGQRLRTAGAWRGEITGRHRDGHDVPQEVSMTLKENGRILCIARDISEQRRVQQEQMLLREQIQLATRRETVAHITSGVAHDLNNLVAVVSGTASLLEIQCARHPEMMAGVHRISRAMDTARELVAGLGHLGKPASPRAVQDLGRLVRQGIDLLGSARIHTHEITVAGPPTGACDVWANPTDVLQVVVNLALNACEAREDPSNRVTISIGAGSGNAGCTGTAGLPARAPDVGLMRADTPYAAFCIRDTGPGIDDDTRQHLFERYFTTKGDKGTGLGLPIVATILRSNDAALWFDSTPGEGTTVTVAWPKDAAAVAARGAGGTRAHSTRDLAGRNILVVDDVADVADTLAEMLETAEAIAIAVSDAAEARRLLAENPGTWAALVTDLHMPGDCGGELAQFAARLDPPVPTVLVTALPDRARRMDTVFSSILSKPVETETLVDHVARAIHTGTSPA
jgi:PAS domain S-box-containing protein